MRATELIDLYLATRARISSPPSPTGIQLERARDGLTAGTLNVARLDVNHVRMADLCRVIERELSDQEREVIFAMRTSIGCKDYERECWQGDLRLIQREGEETIQETLAGERYVRSALDAKGEKVPGRVVVKGQKAVYPRPGQIAVRLGVSERTVFRLLKSAKTAIEEVCSAVEK